MKAMCMSLLLAALIITAAPPRCEAAPSCPDVLLSLTPCIEYVTHRGDDVPPACCTGISRLNSIATTPADRQNVCNCLKTISRQYSGIDYDKAAGLPGVCGVNIPYKISPDTDCTKVT